MNNMTRFIVIEGYSIGEFETPIFFVLLFTQKYFRSGGNSLKFLSGFCDEINKEN